jgi:hypothetical protein
VTDGEVREEWLSGWEGPPEGEQDEPDPDLRRAVDFFEYVSFFGHYPPEGSWLAS